MAKAKVNPDTLPANNIILFINKAQTAFKLLVGPHYIVYHNNKGRKFPLEAIQHFPEFFDGKRLDFSGAVAKAISQKLGR